MTDSTIENRPSLKDNKTTQVSMISATYSAGPIPAASELAKYETILPGSADRIITMAEKQSEHRHAIEKMSAATNVSLSHKHVFERRLGLCFGFIITLIALGLGFDLLFHDKNILGTIFCGVGILPVITVFCSRSFQLFKSN